MVKTKQKTNIVYTGGTFEIPHVGHLNFLRQCSRLGRVVVSLNTDEFIKEYKGHLPVFNYKEREFFLKKIPYVSEIVPNIGGADSKIAIEIVKPNIVAIGTDWAKKDYYIQMGFTQQWLDDNKILLVYLPYMEGISTTLIKQLCKNQK